MGYPTSDEHLSIETLDMAPSHSIPMEVAVKPIRQ